MSPPLKGPSEPGPHRIQVWPDKLQRPRLPRSGINVAGAMVSYILSSGVGLTPAGSQVPLWVE